MAWQTRNAFPNYKKEISRWRLGCLRERRQGGGDEDDRPTTENMKHAPPLQPDTDPSTGTSYTGQRRRGHLFACYSDKHSKETGEVDCFHLEARYRGEAALRQLGIHRPADLIGFDHEGYWEKVLQRLYRIDFERLGRFNANCRRREHRRRPIITSDGRYNRDASAGGIIYHVLGRHSPSRQHPLVRRSYHSVQRFIDVYKPRERPFLIRIRWRDLIDPSFLLPCETRRWELRTL